METIEQLRESLLETTRLKAQAERHHQESELLLGGMQAVLKSDAPGEMFAQMFDVFRQLLPCNYCFVLEPSKPGWMCCTACSDGVFLSSEWRIDALFSRILQGSTLATFRIDKLPEWQSQPESLKNEVGSALYSPVELQDSTAVLVLTSREIGGFSNSDKSLVERFSALVAQTMTSVRAKLLQLENQQLRQAKEKAESELVHAEKMASIGQLAAGVAHEINNPMGFIFSNSSTLRQYVDDISQLLSMMERWVDSTEEPTGDQLKQCLSGFRDLWRDLDIGFLREDMASLLDDNDAGLERIRDIVAALRSFSRQDKGIREAADINSGLELTLKMVMNELKYKAEIVTDLQPLPLVNCQAGRLNQVWMNMLVNASQAIDNFGTITLKTEPVEDGILVSISDTGCGIPKASLARIFDPFYTTKDVGEGTGLGLSISYSIIEQHGGRIDVESEINCGTCFRIYLPTAMPVGLEEGVVGGEADVE
ncbi:hypothetical protein IOQ59_16195 [Pontibacterium sp. N1Y112]|uniref:histidine kinase n=1 Tax=Pontibacterium sinense TaxID=2781979 RepID=A0A8J7FRS0_9GAMM|nr:ATP-binding protein [Pontibacterium sinense]MBE9398802.1 hypothetical protein [Pontibacterium sinense]